MQGDVFKKPLVRVSIGVALIGLAIITYRLMPTDRVGGARTGSDRGEQETDWADRGLEGEIEVVTTRYFQKTYISGRERLSLAWLTVTRFARDGKLVGERFYDADQKLSGSVTIERDDLGRMVQERHLDSSGEQTMRIERVYDEEGRKGAEAFYDSDDRRSGIYAYEYDSEGRIGRRLMEAVYSADDKRTSEAVYTYDRSGQLIEEAYYEEALGGLASRVAYTYERGRRVSSAEYLYGRHLVSRSFYECDVVGNRVKESVYQIPENETGALYEEVPQDELPEELLVAETTFEYSYYGARDDGMKEK